MVRKSAVQQQLKELWCGVTLGHIWERVGGVDEHESVWEKLPDGQMYMCVNCIKCTIINVRTTKRVT